MSKYSNLLRNISYLCNSLRDSPSRLLFTPKQSLINVKICSFVSIRLYQSQFVKCWKCGVDKKSVYELFCDNCEVIQEPQNKDDYFKVLGIDQKYDVDVKHLTQKYRQMQSLLHPDKYSNKSDQEKLISEEYSSIVNRAYNILQSPINRGLHLLCLKGETINENDKNADKEFLMEIMELNEEVEEANTPEELLNLNKKNRQALEDIAQELSKAFQSDNIFEAKKILIRMKYYTSIATKINGLLREKGIVE